jgi:16S rRNA (cytidine1402-2'-O)-methyltransferase
VATPIGHLEDLSPRARRVLGEATLIAAEDTRVTQKLLAHCGIATRAWSLHAHNEIARSAGIVERIARGECVALVSDAGTPAVSDPGAALVRAVRAAGLPVVPVPGPSAVTAILSASGLPADRFHFAGFLPARAAERRRALEALRALDCTIVLYEAPHRVVACADQLAEVLGAERPVVVGRELTKCFEQIHATTLGALPGWLRADPDRQRGEFAVAIGAPPVAAPAGEAEIRRVLHALLELLPPSDAARAAAAICGAKRGDVYRIALSLRAGGGA